MAMKFSERVLHDRIELLPGLSLAFEDPDAEPYFIACGWGSPTDEEPVRTYSQEEVSVDADNTRHNDTGVMVRDLIEHKGDVDKAKAAFISRRAEELATGTLEVQDVQSTSQQG